MTFVLLSSTSVHSATLEEARALWYSHTGGMGTNYTFVFSNAINGTGGGPEYVVDVLFGEVSNVYTKDILGLGSPATNQEIESTPTIEALFDLIEEAESTASSLTATYCKTYGYPKIISITYSDSSTLDIEVSALTPYTLLQHELEIMEDVWLSYNATDYEYTIQVSCFCLQDYIFPKRIKVENNAIISVIDLATGTESDYTYNTILELFARIQRSIDNFDVQIIVSYDPTLGFPANLSIEPEYGLADAGISIEVSGVSI